MDRFRTQLSTHAEEAELWDSLFLTLPEVRSLLDFARENARQVRRPSRLTNQVPSSDSKISRAIVCQPPMTSATWMMT